MPQIGDIAVSQVRYRQLQQLIDDMCASAKNYSRSTIAKVRSTLLQMFAYATKLDYISTNPAEKLEIQKARSAPVQALTDEEIQVLLCAIDMLPRRLDTHYGLSKSVNFKSTFSIAVKTMLYTGLRRGELFALTINDIDRTNRYISVTKQVIYPDNNIGEIRELTKTKAGQRIVPIPDELADTLFSYIDAQRAAGKEYLFCKDNGEIYTYSDIKRRFDTLVRLCMEIAQNSENPFIFPKIHMHQLRHTYCTLLNEACVDMLAVSAFAGHSDPHITLQTYTSLRDRRLADAAEAVRKISFNKEAKQEGGDN